MTCKGKCVYQKGGGPGAGGAGGSGGSGPEVNAQGQVVIQKPKLSFLQRLQQAPYQLGEGLFKNIALEPVQGVFDLSQAVYNDGVGTVLSNIGTGVVADPGSFVGEIVDSRAILGDIAAGNPVGAGGRVLGVLFGPLKAAAGLKAGTRAVGTTGRTLRATGAQARDAAEFARLNPLDANAAKAARADLEQAAKASAELKKADATLAQLEKPLDGLPTDVGKDLAGEGGAQAAEKGKEMNAAPAGANGCKVCQ